MSKIYSSTLKHNTLKLEVIDLFSGCGGFAYGFQKSGFSIGSGIEIDRAASSTASYNLFWKHGNESDHICADVTKFDALQFSKEQTESGCIVIGGPPCQAYSRIGRAKLISLGENRHPINDPRGNLYKDFLRIALELDAKAIVMENVPESTDYGGVNIPQHVCEVLERNGYIARWTILNAADFGVPQIRERVFVLAFKKTLDQEFSLPIPTHKPIGSRETKNQLRFKSFANQHHNFAFPNIADESKPTWNSVENALSDLPMLFKHANDKYKLHKVNTALNYNSIPKNEYQKKMRSWSGDEENYVTGNSFRKTNRDFKIFEKMKPGDDYIAASVIAEDILLEECKNKSLDKYSNPELYDELKKKIVPPYDRTKFYKKWRKLKAELPSHTVVAHLDTDTYSHIHPWEPRGISVREAARLQSFPDEFVFHGTMGESFRQIGNAVPPLLAEAIADCVKKNLKI